VKNSNITIKPYLMVFQLDGFNDINIVEARVLQYDLTFDITKALRTS
jgi:hypothetical protein